MSDNKPITYEMELEISTPVHIGGGEKNTLSSYEYLFIPNNNSKTSTLFVYESEKYIRLLKDKNILSEYIEYISKSSSGQKKSSLNIYNFLKEKKINFNVDDIGKRITFDNVDADDSKSSQQRNLNDIRLCMKNIDGEPYIPGSAIKGAIKNQLLVQYITNVINSSYRGSYLDRRSLTPAVKNLLNYLEGLVDYRCRRLEKNQTREITHLVSSLEKEVFGLNQKSNNKNFGISVSDTYLSDTNIKTIFCRELYKKRKVHGLKENTKSLPIVREYIAPNQTLKFNLTVYPDQITENTAYLKDINSLISKLQEACVYLTYDVLEENKTGTLILGGNTGFFQKTIISALFHDIKERTDITKILLNKSDSPHGKNAMKYHANDIISPRVKYLITYENKEMIAGLVNIRLSQR